VKFFYYPGCSLEATAKEYNHAAKSVCQALGIELAELPDWNCCGATSAHNFDRFLAVALPARNIALAQEQGGDLVTPCSACYSRLKKADYLLRTNPELRGEIEATGEFVFTGKTQVHHLLAVVAGVSGKNGITRLVKKPLNGLQLVCYYGCLLTRPRETAAFDHPENPLAMDLLMTALGAEVKPWSYKTECCGASQGIINRQYSSRLVNTILEMAVEAGAQAIVTACPLCQSNLEMRRSPDFQLPVFYFSELAAIALGLPGQESWLKKHLVNPLPLLSALSLAG